MQSFIEKENIYERQHSCKWYFDESCQEYDALCEVKGGRKTRLLQGINENILPKEIKMPKEALSFLRLASTVEKADAVSSIEKRIRMGQKPEEKEYKKVDDKDVIWGKSFFPLFVRSSNIDTSESNDKEELFERRKFEICKNLNAIDSIIEKLCTKNADFSANDLDGHIVETDTILKWLYAGANQGQIDQQKKDRAMAFCRQIYLWFYEEKLNAYKQVMNGEVKAEDVGMPALDWQPEDFEIFKKKIEELKFPEKYRDKLLKAVELSFTRTLDDLHEIYKKLNGFRRYAIRAKLATDDMKNKENLEKVLRLSYAILNFLLSVCVPYMRVDELQLPRAEFKNARLIHSNISRSNFANADMRDVDISFGVAQKCDFSSATLSNVNATSADFSESLFSYADLSGANFEGATINNCKLDSVALGRCSNDELDSLLKRKEPKDGAAKEARTRLKMGDTDEQQAAFQSIIEVCKTPINDQSRFLSAENLQEEIDNYKKKVTGSEKAQADSHSLIEILQRLSVSEEDYKTLKDYLNSAGEKKPVSQVINLKQASANGCAMPNVDLSLVDMEMASFRDSDLSGARVAYAKAQDSNFTSTNLTTAIAYKTDFTKATFVKALAIQAKFVDCKMESTNFTEANLTNFVLLNTETKNFVKEMIEESSQQENPLKVPQIREKDSTTGDAGDRNVNCDFSEARANDILIACCDISRSKFVNASLRSGILFDCNAASSVWNGADLTFGVVTGVIFDKSSMKDISMQQAKVIACDFSCCNLSRSKFLSGEFDRLNFYDSNLSNTSFAHSTVKNTVFRECLSEKMNVSYAIFKNCLFIGIEFNSFIGLGKAEFENCGFVQCTMDGEDLLSKSNGFERDYIRIGDADLFLGENKDNDAGFVKYCTIKSLHKDKDKKD